ALLERSHRLASIGADDAVGTAWVKPLGCQALLQRDTFAATEWWIIAWPIGGNQPTALQALGEQADGQSVGRRIVVFEDGAKIGEYQKRRATVAGGQQQRSRVLAGCRRCPDPYAQMAPLAEGLLDLEVGLGVIELLWQFHLEAPRHSSTPARSAQIMSA